MKSLIRSIIALFLALACTGVLVSCIGESPWQVYKILFTSAFGSLSAFNYTLYYATPLIFTGLAVALAFHVGLFNIGCEGQLYMGAFATAVIGTYIPAQSSFPLLWIALMILVAFLAGALWGIIPGLLKAYRGSHEVINTIMMNFISISLLTYFALYHFKDHSIQAIATPLIPETIRIAKLSSWFPFEHTSPANFAFFIALGTAYLLYIFLWKTRYGFEYRAVGKSLQVAHSTGINVKKVLIFSMALSGGLAGLVALSEVLGHLYRFKEGFSHGYGFLGIAVALLGRNHPLGIVLASILFGALHNSGIALEFDTAHISRDLVGVIQGLIILVTTSDGLFELPWIKKILKNMKLSILQKGKA